MGLFPNKETHNIRSSGKSANLFRHQTKFRRMSAIGVTTLATAALLFTIMQSETKKQVTLVVNGEASIVETMSTHVFELFEEHEITFNDHDKVAPALDHVIANGDTISIRQAIPVVVSVDGQQKQYYTTTFTLAQALKDWQIQLGKEDRVEPPLSSFIEPGMNVQIVRVHTAYEEQDEVIPYDVVTKADAKLLKGKQQRIKEGQEGLVVSKIKKVYEDGKLISEDVVDTTIVQEVENEIIAVGNRSPVTILSSSSPDVQTVTKDGVTFGIKKVLEKVTLTAYEAGVQSTGKSEDHAAYGVTYTGTKVKEGRTIAVDPKVIPLGWWVYIEGYGLRKAEDIGSAIKGNKIDIYVESLQEANQFGLKRGYTVYVIGPNKPSGWD